ncbi:hypothetical protein [Arthrobacter caoxuetaonis]|uniref:Uncharacterized protein n=1 Tax=Arthrobacter caoxuetaonis TaxID=2886935 RepID=A0A9X1MHE8_9MICC|nr:hypothetical protein [Arthrobacter caoxuetaonis]MCC3299671.1 hypothetical protein [Arthrobacter caoxuetaonis]USQ58988.1 hypothetical protein NF551_17935 [Arthrobacter caoxuetaonis]
MSRKWDSDPRYFSALTILFAASVTVLVFGGKFSAAALFFGVGALYGALLTRVVSRSGRASYAMYCAFSLMFIVLAGLQSDLGVPAAGPMMMGFSAGLSGAVSKWTGKDAGTRVKVKRVRDADGGYPGGWKVALINALCAAALLCFPLVFLGDGAAPGTIAWSTLIGFAGGWVLFRFGKTMQVRSLTLFALFFALLPAMIVAGLYGYGPAPIIAGFGLMAGALIGGRYWTGERLGAPRPPFAGQGNRRRRKKKARKPPARA